VTRGGKRPGAGRPKSTTPADRRIPRSIGLTVAEFRASHDALEPHEEWPDFVREALEQHPRTRVAIAEIEDMIRGCDLTLSTAQGNYRKTTETQRRTLEFVLGL
jgi:hypothetical protein